MSSMCLISKQQRFTYKSVAFVVGESQEKVMNANEYNIYHGKCFKSFKDIRNMRSIVSHYNLVKRIYFFVKMLLIYCTNSKIKHFSFWSEYFFIYKFFENINVEKILYSGHFDRYATWLSSIAYEQGIMFEIIQHGTVLPLPETIDFPHKIYCTKVNGYNEQELSVFKRFIISNYTCVYEVKQFSTRVTFDRLEPQNTVSIGIVSQKDFDFDKELVCYLHNNYPYYELILMLHPGTSDFKKYKLLESYGVRVEYSKKYINLDYVIMKHSTMVYDYIYSDYKGILICISTKNHFEVFKDKIIRIDTIKKIEEVIV